MEHENKSQLPEEENWLEGILEMPEEHPELGPDEHALTGAEFASLEDIEVEKVLQEIRAEFAGLEVTEVEEILQDIQTENGKSLPSEESSASPEELPGENIVEVPAPSEDKSLLEMSDETLMRWAVGDISGEEPPREVPEQQKSVREETAMRWAAPSVEFDGGETRRYDQEDWLLPQEPEQPAQEEPEEEPEPEEEKEEPVKPQEKRRPVGKKGYGFFGLPHLAVSLIWLAIIIGLGVTLGRTLWLCAAEVLAFGKPETSVTITITDEDMSAEDTLERIAAKLQKAGLISYPELFLKYAELTDAEEEISAGTYTLKGTDDYMALVNKMNTYSGSRETVEVMIPEGYTCAQIFALLEQKGVCSAEELGEYAANGELKDYWFLEGVARGTRYCLEGYLFPDTYEFYVGDDPGRVITKMLGDSVGGFDVRFTDIMEEKLVELNEHLAAKMKKNGYGSDYIESHKLTIREVVIIASMIEKETTGSDRYDIASVIYNRLTKAGEYPYLNIDATIIYALGGKIDPETGESIPLTEADMKLDSPYNTYLYKGLPPGPISNPGVYSLLAALDPNETGYYYYVYNPAIGAHKFSETYREHQNYINSMG